MTPISFLNPVIEWLVHLMDVVGAPGVGIAVAAENLFPPIPSEVILPLAGFAAARGHFSVVSAVAWATAGSWLGAVALYGIGAALGLRRIRALADKLPLLSATDVERTDSWFHRHGRGAVLLGRLLPVFRSLISIPAGVNRMSLARFSIFTIVGSAIWNSVLVGAGYLLGANWRVVEDYLGIFEVVVVAAVVAAVAVFVVRRVRRLRRQDRSEPEPEPEAVDAAAPRE